MCHNCASTVRLWSILLDGDLKGFKFILSVFLFLFLFVLLNLYCFFSSFTVGPLWILAKCVNVLYVVNQIGRKLHRYATYASIEKEMSVLLRGLIFAITQKQYPKRIVH